MLLIDKNIVRLSYYTVFEIRVCPSLEINVKEVINLCLDLHLDSMYSF